MTDTLLTRLGVVRRSSDGWGFGLYDESLTHRYWFRTRVDPASRSGEDPRSVQADGLPVVDESTLVWVGLNPSWSDDNPKANRVSLMKVLNWAGQRGLTEVVGVNLFAYRHTDVDGLKAHVSASDLLNSVGGTTTPLWLMYSAARVPSSRHGVGTVRPSLVAVWCGS